MGRTICARRAATISFFAPTVRCVVTVRPQPGLRRDLGIAGTVKHHHGSSLGVYGVVAQRGEIVVGDVVQLNPL